MTKNHHSTNRRTSSPKRLGQAIAIGLLRELERIDRGGHGRGDDCTIEAQYRRKGTRQDNVLLVYLRALRERYDPAVEAGFCSVLSDFVGVASQGSVAGWADYVKLLKLRPRRFVAAKPEPAGPG